MMYMNIPEKLMACSHQREGKTHKCEVRFKRVQGKEKYSASVFLGQDPAGSQLDFIGGLSLLA